MILHLSHSQGVTWGNGRPLPEHRSPFLKQGVWNSRIPQRHALNGVRLGGQKLRAGGKGHSQEGTGLLLGNERGMVTGSEPVRKECLKRSDLGAEEDSESLLRVAVKPGQPLGRLPGLGNGINV